MFKVELRQTKVRAWRGYTRVRRIENGLPFLPKRMVWMEPEASKAMETMGDACGHRIEVTDCYRSTLTQIQSIRDQAEKRRLFAPPTKSGHNFGFSIDIKVKETLENFRNSGVSELVSAGRNRASLARWMKQFGFSSIKKESWHFNFLGEHETTVKKIEAVYASQMIIGNKDVQRSLNKLLGKKLSEPLAIDGMLGVKSNAAAKLADEVLGLDDNGAFGQWFRRVLAGATVTIVEVS